MQYNECDTFAPFIDAGKPVFHIEYPEEQSDEIDISAFRNICSDSEAASGSEGFSTVMKNMNLNGWVEYCNGTTARTSTS